MTAAEVLAEYFSNPGVVGETLHFLVDYIRRNPAVPHDRDLVPLLVISLAYHLSRQQQPRQ